MKLTFKQSRDIVMDYLKAQGWEVTLYKDNFEPLKIPYATSPNKALRYWFKSQALWQATHKGLGETPKFEDARSKYSDMRVVAQRILEERNKAK